MGVAHAGFYLEPGLTYEKGDHTVNWGAPLSPSSGSTSGAGFNLKGGWSVVDTVFFGVDASFSKPQFKNSANNYDAAASSNLLGVMVGGQIPIIGIRAWGGYILDGTLDPEASNGLDAKFSGANGLKLGAGIHFLVVSLNVEYSDLQYKTSTVSSTSVNFTQDFSDKMKNKLWTVSVSFPIML
ncbi:MAG: hypothetical protein H7326_00420 [Bdellovibrionaceae bacterium]|nr:hypothetical protein [Pseudobdellovibrionaceae bacterium]